MFAGLAFFRLLANLPSILGLGSEVLQWGLLAAGSVRQGG